MAAAHSPTEIFWDRLLNQIHRNSVVPVIGPGIVTLRDPSTGEDTLLHAWLLARLEERLPPAADAPCATLNQFMLQHLVHGGSRNDMYDELRMLLEEDHLRPGQSLLDLAAIQDFELYLTTTFDPLPALALDEKRPGTFSLETDVLAFHPKEVQDLPLLARPPLLYHVMGHVATRHDFAVWDEDHMEFICEMQNKAGELLRLFDALKDCSLLLIGSPFTDWVVRFFLRVARQSRLSERAGIGNNYLADDPLHVEESLVVYFDKIAKTTSVISLDPQVFVSELKRRWTAKYGAGAKTAMTNPLISSPAKGPFIPDGTFFISYSREDINIVEQLVTDLVAAGLPVYFDKTRLKIGGNYEQNLEGAVKNCAYFISVVSPTTTGKAESYFHKERRWAARRMENIPDGGLYYLPVVVDDRTPYRNEPDIFAKCHYVRLEDGRATPDFIAELKALHQYFVQYQQRPIGDSYKMVLA